MIPTLFDDPQAYPARSLYQPWAGAVALCGYGYAGKDLETRTQRTGLRGPFVVCAGLKVDPKAERVRPAMYRLLVEERGVPAPLFDHMTRLRGFALAIATITDCRPHTEADLPRSLLLDAYVPGERRFVYALDPILAIDPIHVSGRQGFFPVDRGRVDQARQRWLEEQAHKQALREGTAQPLPPPRFDLTAGLDRGSR